MSDTDVFSEARRVFEILPGASTLEFAVEKLAAAGVEHARIRSWARGVCEEYGILSFVQPAQFARMMAGARQFDQSQFKDGR